MLEDNSLTFPLLSIARYSFIQLSELGHCGENENAQTRGFKPGLPRLGFRRSNAELQRSTKHIVYRKVLVVNLEYDAFAANSKHINELND